MNDRLSEIYASACLYARDKHFEDKDVPAFIQCMSEKFAELIVRECCQVVADIPVDALEPDYRILADHFGVDFERDWS